MGAWMGVCVCVCICKIIWKKNYFCRTFSTNHMQIHKLHIVVVASLYKCHFVYI